MASPQKENGFVPISNELMERLCQANLSGQTLSVMLLLIRCSYGMRKTTVTIAGNEIASIIGINGSAAKRCIATLIQYNLLLCLEKPRGTRPGTYKIQKNWELWTSRKEPWPDLLSLKYAPLARSRVANLRPLSRKFETLESQICDSSARESRMKSSAKGRLIHERHERHDPPYPPKGEPGGGEGEDRLIDHLSRALATHLGQTPTRRQVLQVIEVYRRPPPPSWEPKAWQQTVARTFNEILSTVKDESANGKIGNIIAVTCARTRQTLGISATKQEARR